MSQIPVRALLIVSAMVVGTLITRFLPFFCVSCREKNSGICRLSGQDAALCNHGTSGCLLSEGDPFDSGALWASGNPVCRADCSSSLEEGKFSSQHWYWNCILYVSGAGSVPVI